MKANPTTLDKTTDQASQLDETAHTHQFTERHSRRLVIIVFILLVLCIFTVFAYLLGKQSTQLPQVGDNKTVISTHSPITEATINTQDQNWHTFKQSDFSFQYPRDFGEVTKLKDDFSPSPVVSLESTRSELTAPNYSQSSAIDVYVSSTDKSCTIDAENNIGTLDINGIHFIILHSSDAGAGNRYDSTTYRATLGNNCLEVTNLIHVSSDWNGIDEQAYEHSVQSAQKIFQQIMNTFRTP